MDGDVIVLGGGGHAKVVISSLIALGVKILAIVDDKEEKWGQNIFKVPIVGSQDVDDIKGKKAIIAIGDNHTRKRLSGGTSVAGWEKVVHPHAYVHPSASIGEGTVVFAGAVIQPDAVIGKHCIINTNAIIDHDCIIGDFVHIGPGALLAGDVQVQEGTFLGIGTVVIAGVNIGKWSVVGAGGVVTEDIPDNVTAVGVPAKVIKKGVVV